jgi:hypothetical protein
VPASLIHHSTSLATILISNRGRVKEY